jgi:glycosyltransferase involved in cell wall biosynthesis
MRSATEQAPAAAQQLDISIVMPCLNEEGSVGACVRQALEGIARAGLTCEVIVVDNNSTDGSAAEAAAAGAVVVHETRPGYGSALLRGFAEARGKYMMMGDCDGTYYFGDLQPFIEPLENGYEMVVGNRLTDQLAPGAMPWAHRVIGTPMISRILRIFTGAEIRDSQCGLRSIKRDAYDRLGLRSPGMEFASEMILKAMRKGVSITEVPISYDVRTGESKLSTVRDGWRHLRFLLMSSPSYVFVTPALVLILLGITSLAITIFTANGITIGDVRWEPVFAGGIFLVIGVNLLMLGLIAKLFAERETAQDDGLLRFYRRYLGLERILALAIVLTLIGLAIDLFVFIEWVSDSDRDLLTWATVAQTLIVIGANLGFGGLAAGMVEYEYETVPEHARQNAPRGDGG